jgi:hypothetical protein
LQHPVEPGARVGVCVLAVALKFESSSVNACAPASEASQQPLFYLCEMRVIEGA